MNLVVRLLEESDLAEADLAIQSAFERAMSFQSALRLHLAVEPDGFWVATSDERIVGTVGCVDYGAFAYISLMTVHPAMQRQGIGRRMMDHALGWLDRRKCPMVLLDATDRGALLYTRLGFIDDAVAYTLEREGTAPLDGEPHGVSLAADRDLADIIEFDTPLFGANRQKVLQALWRHERQRCLVTRDPSGRLTGYLFARDPILGPWAATDRETARKLLVAALALPFEHAPQALVPRSNQCAIDVLEQSGFVERRRLRHMRRGGDAPPGKSQCLFGQTSLGHG